MVWFPVDVSRSLPPPHPPRVFFVWAETQQETANLHFILKGIAFGMAQQRGTTALNQLDCCNLVQDSKLFQVQTLYILCITNHQVCTQETAVLISFPAIGLVEPSKTIRTAERLLWFTFLRRYEFASVSHIPKSNTKKTSGY